VLIGMAIGCANVKVQKVDVQDRLLGLDQKVHGFRYYLNRPYLVVAKQVPVTTTYIPVALAAVDDGRTAGENEPLPKGTELFLISQVPDKETGQF
jgi:hypothetical protein